MKVVCPYLAQTSRPYEWYVGLLSTSTRDAGAGVWATERPLHPQLCSAAIA